MKYKLPEQHLIRYLLAGALSYAIELAVLLSLHRLGHLSVEVSTGIAFWIAILTSFLFQKLFAFSDFQNTVAALTHQTAKYGLLVALNYVFTLVVVAIFPDSLIILSRTLALIFVTAWNYFLYKRLIFRS